MSPNPTIGEALQDHYAAGGLPADGGADDATFAIYIGPLTFRLPNPPARRRAVFFHDTTHLLTGYDTVFSRGEMLIAGYELGSGCGHYRIACLINFMMFGLGLLVRPREIYRAFMRGRRCRSLYERNEAQSVLSEMPLAELRAQTIEGRATFQRATDPFIFGLWTMGAFVPAVLLLAGARWLIGK